MGKVFPDQVMPVVVDRLVHHATSFEMNFERCRRAAFERKPGRSRPLLHATIMPMLRRRIPILIVAAFLSRSPRDPKAWLQNPLRSKRRATERRGTSAI